MGLCLYMSCNECNTEKNTGHGICTKDSLVHKDWNNTNQSDGLW